MLSAYGLCKVGLNNNLVCMSKYVSVNMWCVMNNIGFFI